MYKKFLSTLEIKQKINVYRFSQNITSNRKKQVGVCERKELLKDLARTIECSSSIGYDKMRK